MLEETREIQYLKLARESIGNGKINDAERYYKAALSENSENPEAKYFNNFYNFMESFNKCDIKDPFVDLMLSLDEAVKYVAEGHWTDREKSIVITTMKSTYMIIPDYIIEAYINFSVDLIEDCIMSLYWLGSYIKTYFKEEHYYMEIAIEPWKKAIELHQEYGCTYENYKIEEYAKEINKIDPEYIIPERPVENLHEKKAREDAEKAEKKTGEDAKNQKAIMNLNKKELIEKLERISALWERGLEIKEEMDTFAPKDNYERKIVVPIFPGEYESEAERKVLQSKCEHKSKNAVEQMRSLHKSIYAPKEPQKPNLKAFKAPDETDEEKNKSSKYGCLSIAGALIAGFFALGFLVACFDKDNASTLPTIIAISIIGVALFVFSKYQINKIKEVQKKRVDEALVAYNQEKDMVMANYNAKMKEYEESKEAYEVRIKSFLEEYSAWRDIYLKHISEEEQIAILLEQDRIAEVEKIKKEKFTPLLNELAQANDIIPDNYLSAIDIIIDLLKSGRADDVKEALNLYDEIVYREKQLQLQREQEVQRQREEALRREDEERRYREEMRFREQQENQRQREEYQRRQDDERRHREEMTQRAQQERNRQYEEKRQREAERKREAKAELDRKHNEDIAMRRQCNTCALVGKCSMAFRRPNCASYKPR